VETGDREVKYTPEELQSLIRKVRSAEVTYSHKSSSSYVKRSKTFLDMLLEILMGARDRHRDIDMYCIPGIVDMSPVRQLAYREIVEDLKDHLYELPFEELPLHITRGGFLYKQLIGWRLEVGK
jgi:hypothetical protein